MSDYYPDKWCIVKITPKQEFHPDTKAHYRVFATWNGGYLHGNSWKLNSGIVSVTDVDEHDMYCFQFVGESGSVYHCFHGSYGLTAYGEGILNNLIESNKDYEIEVLPPETHLQTLEYV